MPKKRDSGTIRGKYKKYNIELNLELIIGRCRKLISRRSFFKVCATTLLSISCAEFLYQAPTSDGAGYRQIPVLAYHRVGYTEGELTVSPERFNSDLQALQKRGFTSVTLEQFQTFLADRSVELPENPILITFDDGYLDNFEHAYPALQKRGMVGTFFIITGMLGDEERLAAENVIEMSQGGMSIGSHTVSHRQLATLDKDTIHEELLNSKEVLESILGKMVTAIAYPQGSYNDATVEIAQNLGYITGLTTKEGICLKESPDFELRRIPIFKYDSGVLSVLKSRGHLA